MEGGRLIGGRLIEVGLYFNTTGAGGMAAGDAFPTGKQKSVKAKQENNSTLRQCKEHKN